MGRQLSRCPREKDGTPKKKTPKGPCGGGEGNRHRQTRNAKTNEREENGVRRAWASPKLVQERALAEQIAPRGIDTMGREALVKKPEWKKSFRGGKSPRSEYPEKAERKNLISVEEENKNECIP